MSAVVYTQQMSPACNPLLVINLSSSHCHKCKSSSALRKALHFSLLTVCCLQGPSVRKVCVLPQKSPWSLCQLLSALLGSAGGRTVHGFYINKKSSGSLFFPEWMVPGVLLASSSEAIMCSPPSR